MSLTKLIHWWNDRLNVDQSRLRGQRRWSSVALGLWNYQRGQRYLDNSAYLNKKINEKLGKTYKRLDIS